MKTIDDKKIVLTYGDIKEGKLSNFIKEVVPGEEVGNSDKAYNLIVALAAEEPDVEKMWVIFLNANNKTIAIEVVARGSISASFVYPREVVKRILHHGAVAIIIAHNHPSGEIVPSDEDNKMTKMLYFASAIVGCTMHDHMVVGSKSYFSYTNSGAIGRIKEDYKKIF